MCHINILGTRYSCDTKTRRAEAFYTTYFLVHCTRYTPQDTSCNLNDASRLELHVPNDSNFPSMLHTHGGYAVAATECTARACIFYTRIQYSLGASCQISFTTPVETRGRPAGVFCRRGTTPTRKQPSHQHGPPPLPNSRRLSIVAKTNFAGTASSRLTTMCIARATVTRTRRSVSKHRCV